MQPADVVTDLASGLQITVKGDRGDDGPLGMQVRPVRRDRLARRDRCAMADSSQPTARLSTCRARQGRASAVAALADGLGRAAARCQRDARPAGRQGSRQRCNFRLRGRAGWVALLAQPGAS